MKTRKRTTRRSSRRREKQKGGIHISQGSLYEVRRELGTLLHLLIPYIVDRGLQSLVADLQQTTAVTQATLALLSAAVANNRDLRDQIPAFALERIQALPNSQAPAPVLNVAVGAYATLAPVVERLLTEAIGHFTLTDAPVFDGYRASMIGYQLFALYQKAKSVRFLQLQLDPLEQAFLAEYEGSDYGEETLLPPALNFVMGGETNNVGANLVTVTVPRQDDGSAPVNAIHEEIEEGNVFAELNPAFPEQRLVVRKASGQPTAGRNYLRRTRKNPLTRETIADVDALMYRRARIVAERGI